MMQANQKYKGFRVLNVVPVPDCDSTGIYLVHEKTGMEVFHLLNDDEENTFAFIFATPNEENTGVAHIIEHSVLCGSKKYPLKDPFIRLENQSVNTYLNAYTTQDFTVFPVASVLKADYFNLMGVYADAVFFPLLKKEVFMQEGVRLDVEGKNKTISGVVYNEMKGEYSSFESIAMQKPIEALLAGTHCTTDFGGDPLFIPELTYKHFKEFHKKHYCAANCRVFLYGNIPTEEQLDFLEKNILKKISSAGKKAVWPKEKNVKIKKYFHAYGPADSESKDGKNSVICSWKIPDCVDRVRVQVEALFLSALLWFDDCAPVQKALLDSGLGEDAAPQTGHYISLKYPMLFCGLRGVKTENIKKVGSLVLSKLEQLCRDGIPEDDVKRVCMEVELSNKEIVRISGPISLSLLARSIRGWGYGAMPWDTLLFTAEYERLKKRIASDPNYISSLIQKYLLQNKERSLVTVTASLAWSKKRALMEKKIAQKMYREADKDELLDSLQKMRKFQSKPLSKKEENLIPSLKVEDLVAKNKKIFTKESEVNGVTVFSCKEATNGITYVHVAFPADVLCAADYEYIPCLCMCMGEVGWGGEPWDKIQTKIQCVSSGIGAYPQSAPVSYKASEEFLKKPYAGRDWVIFRIKFLEEYTKDALSVLSDCIQKTDFSDTSRLKDLVTSQYNSIRTTIVPYGHAYSSMRAACTTNKACALHEIWEGLSAIGTAKKLYSMPVKKLSAKLNEILVKIRNSGAVVNVIADKNGLSLFSEELPQFIKSTGIHSLRKKFANKDSDFYAMTERLGFKTLGSNKSSSNSASKSVRSGLEDEYIEVPGASGYSAYVFPGARMGTKDSVAEFVYTHLLSTTTLWNDVRTQGGAYGVVLSTKSDCAILKYSTYRDPNPFASLNTLVNAVEKDFGKEFSKDVVDRAITGCYSSEVIPRTPSSKGALAFFRKLYGIEPTSAFKALKTLLKIKSEDIQKAVNRCRDKVQKGKFVVIFGSEIAENPFKKEEKKGNSGNDGQIRGKYVKIML